MADDKKKGTQSGRVTPKQRMKFIGFEVFPGTPKDLFKSDKEKQDFEERGVKRREKGEIIREDCKLLEERVTLGERIVLTVASLVVVLALFLPWYSVYNETVEEAVVAMKEQTDPEALPADSLTDSLAVDSMTLAGAVGLDTTQLAVVDDAAVEAESTEEAAATETDTTAVVETALAATDDNEEIITGHMAKPRYVRDYSNLSGLGSLIALGSVGSSVFGSGFILMFTGLLYLIYTLLCLALPALTIYTAFGLKGTSDEVALKLKKYLKFNWIPVIIFTFTLVISFFGADYATGVAGSFTSVGDAYGPGVFLTTLSWGVFVSMAAFVLVAVKGIEI